MRYTNYQTGKRSVRPTWAIRSDGKGESKNNVAEESYEREPLKLMRGVMHIIGTTWLG